jgi:hypothetical protein
MAMRSLAWEASGSFTAAGAPEPGMEELRRDEILDRQLDRLE